MEAAQAAQATQLPLPLKEDQSSSLGALGAALAKAQGEMDAAKKDSSNPFFNSSYADLASAWDACRGPLSKNGLAVIQRIFNDPQGVGIRTLLIHASGEWIQSSFVLPVKDKTAQGMGSSVTYGRRYALMAAVGIAPDDDDDGNAASGKAKAENQDQQQRQQPPPPQSGSRTTQVLNTLSAKAAKAAETKTPSAAQTQLWERVVNHGAMYGKTEEQMKSFVLPILGGKKRALKEEDIAAIHDALVITGTPIVGGGSEVK